MRRGRLLVVAARLKDLLPALRIIPASARPHGTGALRRAAQAAGAETFLPKEDLDLPLVYEAFKDGPTGS
jgi:hypothetical protein